MSASKKYFQKASKQAHLNHDTDGWPAGLLASKLKTIRQSYNYLSLWCGQTQGRS